MPDILIQCPECSREYKVSEYATMDALKCVTCGAGLNRSSDGGAVAAGGLQLRRSAVRPPALPPIPVPATGEPKPAPGPVVLDSQSLEIHKDVDVKAPPRWVPWLVALAVVGFLIGFQYFSDRLDAYVTYYGWTRNLLAGGTFLLIVMLAFQDHVGQGALCIVFPPYTIFYASSSVESGLLRGVFFGMIIVVMAETYFLPDQAVLLALGAEMSRFIARVDGLLIQAGNSPL